MTETSKNLRRSARADVDRRESFESVMLSAYFVRGLLNDADRLAELEQRVRALADEEMEDARHVKRYDPDRATRNRLRAKRLRALLDNDNGRRVDAQKEAD